MDFGAIDGGAAADHASVLFRAQQAEGVYFFCAVSPFTSIFFKHYHLATQISSLA